MKRLMNVLMLSCRKATALMEKKMHFKLSAVEKMQLYLHTRMCDACHLYEKQSGQIEETLKARTKHPDHLYGPSKPLSEERKQQIVEALKKKK